MTQSRNSALINQLVNKHGPVRSSYIAHQLVTKLNLSDVAAIKAVSRVAAPIHRLSGLRLERGEHILYQHDQITKQDFPEKLCALLQGTESSAGKALWGIEARGGCILKEQFAAVSGATSVNRKGRIRADALLPLLLKYRALEHVTSPDGLQILKMPGASWNSKQKAKMLTEGLAIELLKTWVRNTNFGSFDKVQIRGLNPPPQVAGYDWDLSAPCYLPSFVSWTKGKPNPGFIVADVILDITLSDKELSAFISKVTAARAGNSQPLLPILVFEGLSVTALKNARAAGIVLGQTSTLFGVEAAKILMDLNNALANAAAALSKDPNGVFQIFEKLQTTESGLMQMRGPLMEYIVGHLMLKSGYEIDMGQIIKAPSGDQAEIDVKAKGNGEIICIECKGFSPGTQLDHAIVLDWLNRQVPRMRDWLEDARKRKFISLPYKFEFYFSGIFNAADRAFFIKEKAHRKKYTIDFFDSTDIETRLVKLNETSTLKVFNQYFR